MYNKIQGKRSQVQTQKQIYQLRKYMQKLSWSTDSSTSRLICK